MLALSLVLVLVLLLVLLLVLVLVLPMLLILPARLAVLLCVRDADTLVRSSRLGALYLRGRGR